MAKAAKAVASAPGQIFFFGEHAVVYGKPAIGAAIGLRTTVEAKKRSDDRINVFSDKLGECSGTFLNRRIVAKNVGEDMQLVLKTVESFLNEFGERRGVDLEIKSKIPIKSGMSSSSAFLVSTYAACSLVYGHRLKLKDYFGLLIRLQKEIHGGKASGTELIPSVYGGFVEVKDRKPAPAKIDFQADIVIGDTMVPMSTAKMVQRVAEMREKHKKLYDDIFEGIGFVVNEGREAMVKNDVKRVGELMNINQGLLHALGVSSEKIEKLIFASINAGALGAKISGGGGGKCIVALAPGRVYEVAEAIDKAGGQGIKTDIGGEGLVAEILK